MPSKNMLPKGKRRHSVKADYRAARTIATERAAADAAAREAANPGSEDDGPGFYETADFNAPPAPLSTHPNRAIASNPWIITTGASGSKVAAETHEPPRYDNPYADIVSGKPDRSAVHTLDDLEAEDGIRAFTAEAAAKGIRLDAFLARALPDVSRARVAQLIEAGHVRVDGKGVKSSHKLKGGEAIEIEGEPQAAPLHATPEEIPLDIVFEDADMLVVNKPAGMMVHAGSGSAEHNRGTLVNALLFHLGHREGAAGGGAAEISGLGGPLRPGIVHRLDKETSGLVAVAKTDSAHRHLSGQFAGREVSKTYIALVHGDMSEEEGTVTLPIARDPVRRIRMTARRPEGRSAITHWRVLERFTHEQLGRFTLLEVRIETGRTHQIRVHLSALGHPVAGDTLYGAPARATADLALTRHFLHATELALHHPRTAEPLTFQAPLPEELEQTLTTLRG